MLDTGREIPYTVLMLFWGLTLGVVGKVLLGGAVIMVHSKITDEKRIDGIVLMEMRHERNIALLGIALMIAGYLLELAFYGFIPGIAASVAI